MHGLTLAMGEWGRKQKCVASDVGSGLSVSGADFRLSIHARYACRLAVDCMLWRLLAAHLYNCIAVISPPSQHVCDSLLAVKRVQTVRFYIVFFFLFSHLCANSVVSSTSVWSHSFWTNLFHSKQDASPPSILEAERVCVCMLCELDESCCAYWRSRHRGNKILTAYSCEMGNELRIAFIFLHLFQFFAFISVGSTSRACERTCMWILDGGFECVRVPSSNRSDTLNVSWLNRTRIHLANPFGQSPTPCNTSIIIITIEYLYHISYYGTVKIYHKHFEHTTPPRPLPLTDTLDGWNILLTVRCCVHSEHDFWATATEEKLDILGYEWGDFSAHRIERSDWISCTLNIHLQPSYTSSTLLVLKETIFNFHWRVSSGFLHMYSFRFNWLKNNFRRFIDSLFKFCYAAFSPSHWCALTLLQKFYDSSYKSSIAQLLLQSFIRKFEASTSSMSFATPTTINSADSVKFSLEMKLNQPQPYHFSIS